MEEKPTQHGLSRRRALQRGAGVAGALALAGLATHPVTAQKATTASERTIKCGQRKVGYISNDDPLKEGFTSPPARPTDTYTLEIDERASVTVHLEGSGPGFDQGQGTKGGTGDGRGQDTSDDVSLEIRDSDGTVLSGGASSTSLPDSDSSATISVGATLAPGTYTILVQNWNVTGGDENETYKYQLSVECKSP